MSSTKPVKRDMSDTASKVLRALLATKTSAKVQKPSTKTKKCTKCGKRKSVASFHKQASTKDGLRYECKQCNSERALTAYHANPEHYIDVQRAWQARNPDKIASYRNARKVKDNT